MINVRTPIDPLVGVEEKNRWLTEQGLQFGIAWYWNFCENGRMHFHSISDAHEDIAILFKLKWS